MTHPIFNGLGYPIGWPYPYPILLPVNSQRWPGAPTFKFVKKKASSPQSCLLTPRVRWRWGNKKVGKVWEYQAIVGQNLQNLVLPKLFCGASDFLEGPFFRPSVPGATPVSSFLFLTWIWSWRNWIGMIQGWLSYRMFPWLETTFPIWGQPRQGGQPMSWTCQVETSPCLTGYPQHGTFGQRDHQLVLGFRYPIKNLWTNVQPSMFSEDIWKTNIKTTLW